MKIPKPFTPESDAWNREIDETARALADCALERGDRLTDAERFAVGHCIRWGSDGWGAWLRPLGRKWTLDHASAGGILYGTKAEATYQLQIFLRKWEFMLAAERAAVRAAEVRT